MFFFSPLDFFKTFLSFASIPITLNRYFNESLSIFVDDRVLESIKSLRGKIMTASDLAALQRPSHMGEEGREKRQLAPVQRQHSPESLAHSSMPKTLALCEGRERKKKEKSRIGREEERRLD